MTTIQTTELTATADDGSVFNARRGPLGRNSRDGWSVVVSDGPALGKSWPSVIGINDDQAKRLLGDCVEAYNRWQSAIATAEQALDERTDAIRDYFRVTTKEN